MLVARQGRRLIAGRVRLTRVTSATSTHSQACRYFSHFRAPQPQLLWRPSLCRPERCFKRPPPEHDSLDQTRRSQPSFHAPCLSSPLLAFGAPERERVLRTASRSRRTHSGRASRAWRDLRARSPRHALVRCRGVRPRARPMPPVPARPPLPPCSRALLLLGRLALRAVSRPRAPCPAS
jgi:hypothetical protein